MRWPYADLSTAPIHEKDIGAVAARVLCEDHKEAEYVLTGPESLTNAEQVSAIGRAIGRSIRMEEVSPDEWRRECVSTWPPIVVNMLLDAWAAAIGRPAFMTSSVADLTGAPARTFLDWATDHAAQFRT